MAVIVGKDATIIRGKLAGVKGLVMSASYEDNIIVIDLHDGCTQAVITFDNFTQEKE